MQEQFTVRVYDSKLVNKINSLYKQCRDVYATKNPFLVDCIVRGLDSLEKDFFGVKKIESLNALYDEIKLTIEKLNTLIKATEKNSKENLANLSVNQKLLSCNYNMLLGLSENNPLKRDFVEAGLYDNTPERLEEILEEILKVYLKK